MTTPTQSADGLREQIETLLDNDPVCNGRVSYATVEAIVALQSLPHTEGQSDGLTDRLQAAWDSYPFGLPPIVFTDAEAQHLAQAFATNTDVQEAIERCAIVAEKYDPYAVHQALIPNLIASAIRSLAKQGERVWT